MPYENLLGAEGEGFIGSLKILDGGRISIAALALGMAQGALEAATKYAKQRKQFGQPISEFQAIQFKLADMATEVEAARLLVYQAAWLADRKDVRFTRESRRDGTIRPLSANRQERGIAGTIGPPRRTARRTCDAGRPSRTGWHTRPR